MRAKIRPPLLISAICLVIAAATCLAGTAQASASTPAIGLYEGPANVAGINAFSTWLGKPVMYATDYVAYTNGWSVDFNPQWLFNAWGPWVRAVSGRRLVLGVPLLENGYTGQFAQEAAGQFDSYFAGLATQLVSHGLGNTIIRLGYEANNPGIGPWQATDNPSGYISAYRHIVGVLRSVPGQHFLFDWNPSAGLTPGHALDSFASFYPGDDVVDIIGLDVYDIDWYKPGVTPQQAWSDKLTETMGLEDQRNFAALHNKPVSFPEWGVYPDQNTEWAGLGDDPYFVNQFANWISSGNTAYQSYFNIAYGVGGTLASNPLSQAAYLLAFGPIAVPVLTTPAAPTIAPLPTAAAGGSSSTSGATATTTNSSPSSGSTGSGKATGGHRSKGFTILAALPTNLLSTAMAYLLRAGKVRSGACNSGSSRSSRGRRPRCHSGKSGATSRSTTASARSPS